MNLFSQWQLYCDKNSFAVKINFKAFLEVISNVLNDFEDEEVISAKYGRVEYMNLYEQATKNATMIQPYMSSFIKHKCYIHERELRFLLFRENGNTSRKGIKIKMKDELIKIKSQIEIIAHPDMDTETFSVFKNELNKSDYNLVPSNLVTKNNFDQLIQYNSD